MPPMSRFHRPTPSSPQRKPIDPLGTAGSPVSSSSTTVFHSAFSPVSPRSEAQEAVGHVAAAALAERHQNGMSVVRRAYSSKYGVLRST